MNDTEFHAEQMARFAAYTRALEARAAAGEAPTLEALVAQFNALAESPERLLDDGPALVARLFTTAPQFTEAFPRGLLWYLGGECLHFMPDDEIDTYSRLDEQRRERAKLP